MRIAIILCFLLSACNPQQRALKSAKKHWGSIQELLMKYPELADTLELVRRDTIRLEGFQDTVMVVNDASVWGEDFFKDVDTLAKEVVKNPAQPLPVTRLQKRICPELVKDTTYHIAVYNAAIKRLIPIHIKVRVKDGKAGFSVLAADVKIPDPEIVKQLEFKPVQPKFYRDQWFWVTVTLALLLVLSLLRRRK